MTVTAHRDEGALTSPPRVLVMAAALHICNDAFFAIIYPLLPFIAAEFDLSYASVGLLKTAFSASSGVLQLPAGLLAERWGEYALLAWGNGWVAAGLVAMAAAGSFGLLLTLTVVAGLGGNVQHPLASTMVARAWEGSRRGTAIGTLNFAGDLGKMSAPALVGLFALTVGWRGTLVALGIFGILFSIGVAVLRPWVRPPPLPAERRSDGSAHADQDGRIPSAFWMLCVVGMLDGTTRTAALTFLPFALEGRGMGTAEIGFLFSIVFAGGAAGKFLCGPLGDRFGPFSVVLVTELTTALALCGLVWGPTAGLLAVAVVFGFGLNGTSSVLYAAVAQLVPSGKRGRGYGLYYTVIDVAAAAAPVAYGVVADRYDLAVTFGLMALLTFAVVPLAAPMRRYLVG
ncbi:MAG: MFS transporter [Chloroflexota bacterium]